MLGTLKQFCIGMVMVLTGWPREEVGARLRLSLTSHRIVLCWLVLIALGLAFIGNIGAAGSGVLLVWVLAVMAAAIYLIWWAFRA